MITWPDGNTIVDWGISYVDDSRFYRGHHGGREMVDFTIVGKGSFFWMLFVSEALASFVLFLVVR